MTKTTRALSILITICMSLSILPALAGNTKAAGSLYPTPSSLFVNGVDVLNQVDHKVKCGAGTVRYTPADNTLTLDNATITVPSSDSLNGIYSDGDITIKLIGKNIIAGDNIDEGIRVSFGNVRVTGPGSLESVGKKYGIYIYEGSLYVGSKLTAKSLNDASTAIALIHRAWDDVNPLTLGTGMHYPSNLYFTSCVNVYDTWVFTQSRERAIFLDNDQFNRAETEVTITSDLTYNAVTPVSIPASIAGQAIIPIQITGFSGGTAPYQFTASGLPEGLSISAGGTISGTPLKSTAAGTAAITYTDANGLSAAADISYGSVIAFDQASLSLAVSALEIDDSSAAAVLTKEELISSLSHVTPDNRFALNVDITAPTGTESIALKLPAQELRAIGMNTSLTVTTPLGTLSLDSEALNSITGKAENNDFQLTVKKVSSADLNDSQNNALSGYLGAPVYEFAISVNNLDLNALEGTTTLSVPLSFAPYQSEAGLSVFGLNATGNLQNAAYHYMEGAVRFTARPDQAYVVSYSESAGYANPYHDVMANSWYFNSVKYVTIGKLMSGTRTDSFSPETATTRGMIVTILYRLEGKPYVTRNSEFKDVKANAYYTDAVKWASTHNIVSGYGWSYDATNGYGNKFGPDDTLTREQMMTILYRYAVYKGYDVSGADNLAAFKDSDDIQPFALSGFKWGVAQKIISGTSAVTITPKGSAQRSQIAAILERFIKSTI